MTDHKELNSVKTKITHRHRDLKNREMKDSLKGQSTQTDSNSTNLMQTSNLNINFSSEERPERTVVKPTMVSKPVHTVSNPSNLLMDVDLRRVFLSNQTQRVNFRKPESWVRKYDLTKIISIDCEMVEEWYIQYNFQRTNIKDLPFFEKNKYIIPQNYRNLSRFEKRQIEYVQKAGTVAIVSVYDEKYLYSTKIKREPESFRVTPERYNINGIGKYSLKNGKNINEVRTEVMNIIKDKLIITCAGFGDFKGLELEEEFKSLDIFDLQDYFYNLRENAFNSLVREPIGLRRIYWYLFGEDCQEFVHSAEQDALNTAKAFKMYVEKCDSSDRKASKGFTLNEIPPIEEILQIIKNKSE